MIIHLEIPGKPIGKGRPRFSGRHAYTPKRTRDYEAMLAWEAKRAMVGKSIITGPVEIEITAIFERKKKTDIYPKRPDLDNIMKCLDSFNKIIWDDDGQIINASLHKKYGIESKLIIVIKKVNNFF